MRKKGFLLVFYLINIGIVNAQSIDIKIPQATFNTGVVPAISARILDNIERDRFSKQSGNKITITITGTIPANTRYYLNGEQINTATKSWDITDEIRDRIIKLQTKRSYKFTLTNPANTNETDCGEFEVIWEKLPPPPDPKEAEILGAQNKKKIIDQFRRKAEFSNPYDNKADRIDLFFDDNGRLLNYLPVSLDQNDIFYMHVVCAKGDEIKYRVNVVQGEYAPVDLAIRPFEKLTGLTVGQGNEEVPKDTPKEYTSVVLRAGPYTSDFFKFQVAYDSSESATRNGPEYKVKINKLFHVGVGVSIITSGLQNPDYKTYYNGTDTTIKAFNNGRRTIFTFNVIWYWTILQQKKQGSVIPNGRDVLKDEPTFSLSRLFPTVGVSIDNKFRENFFIGAVYEFARGGSLTVGLHYGRVDRLADRNFELEKTKFSGIDQDIKLDQVYKSGFFIGLNVDTRVLNLLFSRGQ